jgi:hypothetical protein
MGLRRKVEKMRGRTGGIIDNKEKARKGRE